MEFSPVLSTHSPPTQNTTYFTPTLLSIQSPNLLDQSSISCLISFWNWTNPVSSSPERSIDHPPTYHWAFLPHTLFVLFLRIEQSCLFVHPIEILPLSQVPNPLENLPIFHNLPPTFQNASVSTSIIALHSASFYAYCYPSYIIISWEQEFAIIYF